MTELSKYNIQQSINQGITFMLPPIHYKMHPKMLQIIQEKRIRKQILENARKKQMIARQVLKEQRQQYIKENKERIAIKSEQILSKKIIKRNLVRQEEKQRPIRIMLKRSERLMQLIPERRNLIQMLRQNYLKNIETNEKEKNQRIQQLIEAKITKPQLEIKLEQKIRQNNIIDTNEGVCVICLTSEAHLYMIKCRHLISCKDCEFILRMQKKCPLCRAFSQYSDLKARKKVSRSKQKQL